MSVVQGPLQTTGPRDWKSHKSLGPEDQEILTSVGPGGQGSTGVPSPSEPPPKPAIPRVSSLHPAPPSVQPSAPPRLPPRPPYTEAAPWMDVNWRTVGRVARWYLKSSRSARRDPDYSGRPTPPPPRECRELWSLPDASTEVSQGPARHAGAASPSGAPQDFGSWHPRPTPEDSSFPGAPAAGHEDGGSGQTPLKQPLWNLLRRRGRSGSSTRTGKSPGGKRSAPASTRPSAARSPHLLPPGSRVTASCS